MTPKQYAYSLRRLAAWYEDQPEDTPVPLVDYFTVHLFSNTRESQAAEAIRLSAQLGECEKEYVSDYLVLKRKFGKIELRIYLNRDAVCTRKVVGFKTIPASYFPERIEEIVEWECHPLLTAGKDVHDDSNKA